MKKTHLIVLLVIHSIMADAQNYIDLVKCDYAITPANHFKNSTATTTLQEMNGELTVPIRMNDQLTFLTGFIYESSSAAFDTDRIRESVYGTTLKLGVSLKHNPKWTGTYVVLPKISSDLKRLDHQDFQAGAYILMQNTKSTHLNYKFGAYANTDLFGPFIVPLLGFYYLHSNEKLEVKVLLPVSADVNYSILKKTRFGFNFKGLVRSYHLNKQIGNQTDSYLVKSTNDLYSYVQYGFNNGLNFQFAFGRSLARSYRMYNEKVNVAVPLYYAGDRRTQLNTDFSDGWLFKFSLLYRLKINS